MLPRLSTYLGHTNPANTYWYLSQNGFVALAPISWTSLEVAHDLPGPNLGSVFRQRLARQRQASGHTVAAYRDCFRLLLEFLHQQTGTAPAHLGIQDLNAAAIGAFLDYLENDRGNSVRTRNSRLARCIPSFASPRFVIPSTPR